MIVWLNGTHGVGKTTTAALLQRLIPDDTVRDLDGGHWDVALGQTVGESTRS